MKKLFIFLKKNLELFAVFASFFILSIPHLIDLCTGYLSYVGYDIQEFLLWNYASLRNVILYRDIFYPYGLLHYFRNDNSLFLLLNYLITPLIFTVIFYLLRIILKNRHFLYLSSFFLFVFVCAVTGLDVFSRYGIFISFSLLYSYLLYSKKIKLRLCKLLIGLILGLVFSLVNDQGSYLIFSYVFLYLFNEVINKKIIFSLRYCSHLILDNIYQGMGFFIGLIPLLFYLALNNSLIEYFKYFRDVQNIAIVAKTPFFSFITSPANLFTIFILFFAIFFLLIKNLYYSKKLSLSSFFEITLIFDILLLEQKSIVRSIDKQITFIAFILYILILYEIVQLLNKYKIKTSLINFLYACILMIIIFLSSLTIGINQFSYSDFKLSINSIISNKCYDGNFNLFLSKNNEYINVINELKRQPGFNKKVFSFPTGDSAFYVILGQKPPYYNAIFEGSSQSDQLQAIKYMQNNSIDFVTLDVSMKYIQDGVPDYIRQPIVFKYIISSYYPIERVGKHLILKRISEKDFFTSELLTQIPAFKKYLLDVYLYRIPYSEGLYKYNRLKATKSLIDTSDISILNQTFAKTDFDLSDKIIVMIPSSSLPASFMNYISFKSNTGEIATVFYNSCKKDNACIIDMENIPFFYKPRIIKQITVDNGYKGQIIIFDSTKRNNLW
jgi:hypothetical protein